MSELAYNSSTYRLSNLYIQPNWNGNTDRVAMSCGIGAFIKVLRKNVMIKDSDGASKNVNISADPAATAPRTWYMTARNTIIRSQNVVYLYARVERNGTNGMYIWSENIYHEDGTTDGDVEATNRDRYYYILVGTLGVGRKAEDLGLNSGSYKPEQEDETSQQLGYDWKDLIGYENGLLVFLKTIGGLAVKAFVLAGSLLDRVLTKDTALDDTDVTSDRAVVTGGFLNKWIDKIKGMFLRKDEDESTTGSITMENAVVRSSVKTASYNGKDSIDGSGAAMWEVDERGEKTGHIVTDYFTVRRAATFRSLSIIEVNHMGGEVIISAADCEIAYVEPLDAEGNLCSPYDAQRFRCYFEKEANGRVVYNEWKKYDQAYCRRYNVAEKSELDGSFYWRMVVDVHQATEEEQFHWIDLSNVTSDPTPHFASGSNTPKANDKIVLFGHQCHRDESGEDNYDRTCAQVYSTVGENAPSRDYYYGIGTIVRDNKIAPFFMPKSIEGVGRNSAEGVYWNVGEGNQYIKYSTENGLDIHTSSFKIVASDNSVTDVASVLGYGWSFFTTESEAQKVDGEYVKWLPASALVPKELDEWNSDVWANYIGYQIITPRGITFSLSWNGSSIMWKLNTDRYLLAAQESADQALSNLEKMADDKIITEQEKSTLKMELEKATLESNSIVEQSLLVNISSASLQEWYHVFYVMMSTIVNRAGDTMLENGNSPKLYLTIFKPSPEDTAVVDYTPNFDTTVGSSPIGKYINFRTCYQQFYMWMASAKAGVTRKLSLDVDNILAGDSDINQRVNERIDAIYKELIGEDGDSGLKKSVQELYDEYAVMANNVVYENFFDTDEKVKQWNAFKGFVTSDNFASVFATAKDENGKTITEALMTTYVSYDPESKKMVSGIKLSADQIDFSAESVSVFTQNFHIASDQLSIFYDDEIGKEVIIINTDNFKLDNKGNAEFKGDVRALNYFENLVTYDANANNGSDIVLGSKEFPLGTVLRVRPHTQNGAFVIPKASDNNGRRLRIVALPRYSGSVDGVADNKLMVKIKTDKIDVDGFQPYTNFVMYMMAAMRDGEVVYDNTGRTGAIAELMSDGDSWVLVDATGVVIDGN